MEHDRLTEYLLTLPLPERVALAQTLWESIGERTSVDAIDEEREAVDLARRRDDELRTGVVAGRSHQQVMDAARRALGECS